MQLEGSKEKRVEFLCVLNLEQRNMINGVIHSINHDKVLDSILQDEARDRIGNA